MRSWGGRSTVESFDGITYLHVLYPEHPLPRADGVVPFVGGAPNESPDNWNLTRPSSTDTTPFSHSRVTSMVDARPPFPYHV